jgi:hypothetical protein
LSYHLYTIFGEVIKIFVRNFLKVHTLNCTPFDLLSLRGEDRGEGGIFRAHPHPNRQRERENYRFSSSDFDCHLKWPAMANLLGDKVCTFNLKMTKL